MTELDLARDHVDAILAQLNLESDTAGRARALCESADWSWPINRGGPATAAGAVYLATLLEGERVKQSTIAQRAGCSEVALRQAWHELSDHCEADATSAAQGRAIRAADVSQQAER